MNIFSLIGMIGTFAAIVISMYWGGTGVMPFVSIPSVFIVVVASFMIVMLAGPKSEDSIGMFKLIGMAFKTPNFGEQQIAKKFIALSEKARREGLLSLEEEMEDIDDDFLQGGLRLAIDGTDKEVILGLLEIEITKMQERHAKKHRTLELWATVAPATGMWGTVIGLVGMMQSLSDDPGAVGANMATALITTLYGSVIANAIAIPVSKKLRIYDAEEVNSREMIIEGILSIQAGENTRILSQKLLSYLPPADRKELEQMMKND